MMVVEPTQIPSQIGTVDVCDYPILPVSLEQVVGHILWQINNRQGSWIVTLNLDLVARGEVEPDYGQLIRKADIITADGSPLVWGARKKHVQLREMERTTGADLTAKLIHLVAPRDVAIIGGHDPKRALTNEGLNPNDPWFIFDGKVEVTPEFAAELAAQMEGRHLIFVALGCPKQERLIHLLREHLPNSVFIGVGGSFDFLAGATQRAPQWMQDRGLEWLFRIYREPKRIGKRVFVGYIPGLKALLKDVYRRGR
jgi:N-acetylglucosaminyldiphosphoundecaprenol N-acetyl-beta-D-mannosaminyltransferase